MITVGDMINGFQVVAVAARHGNVMRAKADPAALGIVVLAQRYMLASGNMEYVTARMAADSEREWFHGNYFHGASYASDAWEDFIARTGGIHSTTSTVS